MRAPVTTSAPVTVAVVSWNTRELLLRCLDALAADVEAGTAQVVVVDNDSSDGSVAAARARATWAQVVEAGANLGFGPAVNLVAIRTQSPWLLALNADVALEPGALSALLRAGADPSVACVAPRLILPNGHTQHSVHPLPTVALVLAFNLGLHRVSRSLADRLCLEGFWDPERPRDVPWAIGACLLLRREQYAAVGGFDERQWMYAEDLDLGWRLHERGYRTRYEPRARARHESGAAAQSAFGDQRTAQFLSATYAMLRRRRGGLRMAATATINILGAALRVAWMAPASLLVPRLRSSSAENRRWLAAHLQGVRRSSTRRRPAPAPARPRRPG